MKYFFIVAAEIAIVVLLVLIWKFHKPQEKISLEPKTLAENFALHPESHACKGMDEWLWGRIPLHGQRNPELTEATAVKTWSFTVPANVSDGQTLGQDNFLTFELFRNGTFLYHPDEKTIEQRSASYRDASYMRSTDALPHTYRVRVTVGMIEYDLENISGIPNDPEYSEGPQNENGCYLLTIVDEIPSEHYTNDWWHAHRKVVIDIDNNIWGHGMPQPVFMVYFDKKNELVAHDEISDGWAYDWVRALKYEKNQWYIVEIERTDRDFILRVYDASEHLLEEAHAPLGDVWHSEGGYPDYFVIGDPHENYYQGSMRIKNISFTYTSR